MFALLLINLWPIICNVTNVGRIVKYPRMLYFVIFGLNLNMPTLLIVYLVSKIYI